MSAGECRGSSVKEIERMSEPCVVWPHQHNSKLKPYEAADADSKKGLINPG